MAQPSGVGGVPPPQKFPKFPKFAALRQVP
jgi:hypothetical protein